MRNILRWTTALSVLAASPAFANELTDTNYPDTRRGDVVETLFGEKIADPYRWLENDVREDKEVADWVARQSAFTDSYLKQLPQRGWFEEKVRGLLDFERFGLPDKAGKRYFYTRNSGLLNQSQLFVRDGLDGEPRLLIDPNTWASDGATALSGWTPSKEGSYLLYSVQDGGSDWRILHVLDVATGKVLEDEIRWVKFSDLAWVGEKGFLYSRYPAPGEGEAFQSANYDHTVYYHELGTPQSQDVVVYRTPEHPEYNHSVTATQDGHWAIVTSSIGTDARFEIHAIDLTSKDWTPRVVVGGFDDAWELVEGMGDKLWFVTNKDAPRKRLVQIDLGSKTPKMHEVVPQAEDILERAGIVGNRLVLNYMRDAASHAVIVGLDGKSAQEFSLSGIGTASGFHGKPGDPETFYSFTSFNRPPSIFRMNIETGETTPFAEPEMDFDPEDFAIEQRFYASKDGTKVPMFIVRRKDVVAAGKPVPTLLYGYGGFDIALTPGFSASRMAWIQAGGAYVLANLRGGGEYGRAWHDAGRRENKQNVFDDFIAAGEYLKAQGITSEDGLAINGGSNGGLLVGAVTNQRPDLFAAAVPQVGVMDMLRFDRFTAGRYWVDDFGYPDKEADFRIIRRYSPYHNIADGQDYPAVLVTTADTDDRVVPGHSFKYAAAIQHADLGDKPHLIRIETRAGHGSGKPTDKVIEESADILSFMAEWTGLEVPEF
ncbi:prolyl oligopeptidase family serine peptidase [Novosphingobium decolorationis]|uniref:prolyl oligopeptidase n=1 Tax=Novosphingobium decolorationis TaxID=2698673 RepID=A0ABX8EC80_9SPHN|nr:prolyl oligopeptidase family serine peptidase [Novosphingobium decolorationis]QVM85581.1 S9 family peptidase [Novosphingobium decolorationis]